MEAEDWRELDKSHHLHPFTNLSEYSQSGGRVFSSASGIYIHDLNGRQILDGMSGLWCCNLGYSQPAIVNAVTDQLRRLPYYNSFFNCSNDAAVELSARLASIAPERFNHFFFTSSGSEANDTNIRIVHRYFDLLGKRKKKHIVSRKNSYHGSTIAAANLGGMSGMHAQVKSLSYVHHVAQPYWYREGGDMDPQDFGVVAAQSLEEKVNELGAENVAAFIAEPIQGAGGVIIAPESYWLEIQRICDDYDILLISDEVICGFGRMGDWFGSTTLGTRPDLITFAKGVTGGYQPLGGVAVSDKVADVLTSGGGEFAHGFTYSGHPAACAAGIATLEVMSNQRINDYVASEIGFYFGERVNELAEHPIVGEVRSRGMLAAFELVRDKRSCERIAEKGAGAIYCRDSAIANGLMVRAVGDSIVAAPPLICSKAEVDELMHKLVRALDETAAEFGVRD